MLSAERQQVILDLIEKSGRIEVADLVARFEVSEMTIRRDLDILDRKGLLRRVHGGAVSNQGRSYEPSFLSRSTKQLDEKMRIGKAAANLIQSGDSVLLDIGTTTLEIARHLRNRQNLTIITPGFQIASILVEQPGIRLILTGGILRPGELSLVGHLAERAIGDFYVDKLFLGAAGVDLEAGFTEFNLEDTLIKHAMLHRSKDITVVADSSKFGQIAFTAIAPLHAANRIITDKNLAHNIASKIRELGIELILV